MTQADATPTPAAPQPATATTTAADVIEPQTARVQLYPAECPDCGVPFALPAALYLRRLDERGHVYCPAGHLIELRPDDLKAKGEATLYGMMLIGQLREARMRIAELRRELQRRPAPAEGGPITPEELKRRVSILANRLEGAEYGRKLCSFCGSKMKGNDTNVRRHLKQKHAAEIAAMEPAAFD